MKPRLAQLHPSGAVDNDVATYDSATGKWGPAAPAGSEAWTAEFSQPGTLVAESASPRWYNRTGATKTLTEVFASVDVAPTGSAIIIDIEIDGTSVWSNPADRPTIAASGFTVTATDMNTTALPDGSYLQAFCVQIGSTVAGADLGIQVST